MRDCTEGKIRYAEAAERCGVVPETMRRWVSRYCAEGAASFLSPQRNRVYSPAQKEAAVKAYILFVANYINNVFQVEGLCFKTF